MARARRVRAGWVLFAAGACAATVLLALESSTSRPPPRVWVRYVLDADSMDEPFPEPEPSSRVDAAVVRVHADAQDFNEFRMNGTIAIEASTQSPRVNGWVVISSLRGGRAPGPVALQSVVPPGRLQRTLVRFGIADPESDSIEYRPTGRVEQDEAGRWVEFVARTD